MSPKRCSAAWIKRGTRAALCGIAIVTLPFSVLAQQDEREREKIERVPDVLVAIGAKDGAHIADVGSADGFYTLRIAKAVAPSGKAYAIDIEQKSLDKLRERAQKEAITNVEIILSEPADPKLPTGVLDAVLIRNAYHEMVAYREILKGVMSGLKPGGLLVVSEGISDSLLDKPREQQVKEHYIAPGIVEAELREAGFEIVDRDDAFTRFTGRTIVGGYWMIRARRPAAAAQESREVMEQRREGYQRVGDIFQAMGIAAGARVADVGAGGGFFTTRLATAVGPTGHVFAVDIGDDQLDRLRQRLSEEGHRNVTVIKGTPADPQLPAATLDAALIINAYHEMPEHQAMLEAIRKALKPTGRLVLVEPISDRRRQASRAQQVYEHEIAPEFVLQDARAAGLRIIGLEDPFTTRGTQFEWMMTLVPSASGGASTATTTSSSASSPSTEEWRNSNLRISIEELIKLGTSRVTIIDVRDETSFTDGHIPNAVLIPLESVEASVSRLQGLKRPFVTYCS